MFAKIKRGSEEIDRIQDLRDIKRRQIRSPLNRKSNRDLLLICLPALIKVFIFSYLPMIGIVIAFQFYIPRMGFLWSPWVGLDNFVYLVKSSSFTQIVTNAISMNLLFILTGTFVSMALGLLMFELTNKYFLRVTQTLYFFPYFIGWALVAAILEAIIGETGILTKMLSSMGVEVMFYKEAKYWKAILTIVNIWKGAGVSAVVNYAVLLGVDKEIYEAADIDGATRFRKMIYLSLPFLKNMVVVGIIMNTANILRFDFGMVWFLTGDRSALQSSTDVIETYMYRALRNNGNYSVSAAVGLLQGVVGIVLSVITNAIVRRVSRESTLF